MGIFGDLFSTKPAEDAAKAKIAGLNAGMDSANSALDAGLGAATPLYNQAYGNFNTLAGKFGAGQDAYNDATGTNGQAGIDRATTAFKSLPGYQGGLTTGIDQVNRNAAARGMLGGGNTSADEIKFASDYDASKYGNYVSSLAPNLTGALGATSGGAGVLNNQATANLGVAGQKANYGYQGQTGIGNANADAEMAKYSVSSNFWNTLMGGAKLAVGAASGMPMGGGGGTASTMSYGGQSWPMYT